MMLRPSTPESTLKRESAERYSCVGGSILVGTLDTHAWPSGFCQANPEGK